jgi:hypothetical protein
LTVGIKIALVVEAVEKRQLPEAPISISVETYLKGFRVLVTRRMLDEQSIIAQVPGIVALVDELIKFGFEPSRVISQPLLPTQETKDTGKESPIPVCQIHNIPMVWREGMNSQTRRNYAFWACPTRLPDGSFCKYRPTKNKPS